MLITDLTKVSQLPAPSLGLLNAVHTASVINISTIQDNTGSLPLTPPAKNVVYVNDTNAVVVLPSFGNYPARPLYPTEFCGTNASFYYKVVNRKGNSIQISDVSDGLFSVSGAINSRFVSGQMATFAGFQNASGFINGNDYQIANVDNVANTFQIKDQSGAIISSASAGIAGWIHTHSTNSYYAAHFERTAYSVSFSGNSFRVGNPFSLAKLFTFRAIAANTAVVWSVFFEFGVRKDSTDPAPIGPNIQEYNFLPPALEQQVVMTDLACNNTLGLSFTKTGNTGEDFMTGQRFIYSTALKLIPGTYPQVDDFILRIRLGCLDIQDNATDLSGYVGYVITDAIQK
jgi:hypothetical protein